jgi:hypothetical protein
MLPVSLECPFLIDTSVLSDFIYVTVFILLLLLMPFTYSRQQVRTSVFGIMYYNVM